MPRRAGAVQSSLLGLQHAAGNQAVSSLLARPEDRPDVVDAEQADEVAAFGLGTTSRSLDAPTRIRMEGAYGHDLGHVRLHTGEQAEESAAAMRAKAYTVGHDIVFGRGRHAPGTVEGRRLLAHELAHVIQQDREGAPAPRLYDNGPLELAANRAAAKALTGGEPVVVSGAAGPGVMRQPDDVEESKASRRAKEKRKTQQRKRERAEAGKEESQLSRPEAERELRALENSYRQLGAKRRALKTKERDLKRYKGLLKRAGGTQLEQNQRQGAFDELQRTPTTTSGKPQTKHVAGGPQLPGQELRPGKDPYAQPDYSAVRRRKDGTLERVHVNLKSDQIDMRTAAKARATARAYVDQAIRNSRHLASGEKIIISFAHTPSKEVQEEMKRELFKKGSPIGEVRFGTTTHRRENYRPPPSQPAGPKSTPLASPKAKKSTQKGGAKKAGTKPAKKTTAKPKAPPTSQTTHQKLQTPKPTRPKTTTAKVTPPGTTTTTTAVKVATPKVTTSKPTTLKTPTAKVAAPTATTPRVTVTVPKVAAPKAPKIPLRSGLRGGGGMRGGRGAAGAAIVEAIAVPIINHYMRKHFADKIETEARELMSKAIEGKRKKYEELIEARRTEIQSAQAEGREVTLRVAVDTSWQDTDIGTVLMSAKVGDYQLVFEDGPPPKPYKRKKPGGVLGKLVRAHTGTELTFETFDIALEGTDPEARARRQSRAMIDLILNATAGSPPVPFEFVIIDALTNNRPLDALSDYAAYRTELAGRAFEAGVPAREAGLGYWAEMAALMDGTLDQLIAAAKAKSIPLDKFRAVAVERRDLAGQSSDVGAGPAAAAYWSEVVRLIDAK